MQYGFDRVKVLGLSGNVVRGNYLVRYEAALNDGRKFQNLDPLIGWSEHEELVSGFGLEYSGLSDAVLSFEINNSNIVNYSRSLLPDENQTGFIVQARWNGLNDLLSVYGAFNRFAGDNSTISTLFAEYELTDDIKELLKYEEDTAGGLMAKELVKVNENLSISNCLDEIRKQAKRVGTNDESRKEVHKLMNSCKVVCSNCWIKLDNDLIEFL